MAKSNSAMARLNRNTRGSLGKTVGNISRGLSNAFSRLNPNVQQGLKTGTQTLAGAVAPIPAAVERLTRPQKPTQASAPMQGPQRPGPQSQAQVAASSRPATTSSGQPQVISPTPTPSVEEPRLAAPGVTRQKLTQSPAPQVALTQPNAVQTQAAPSPALQVDRVSPILAQQQALRERITGALVPGLQEQAVQQQLTDLQGATAQGVLAEQGQGRGIPLALVRGRQALLQEQGQLQQQTLQQRLANIQAQRQAELQAAIAQEGFAAQDIAAERDAALQAQQLQFQQQQFQAQQNKPFEFGGNLVQFDPATGQVRQLAQGPTAVSKPITVSPGQTIIDPNTGEILFQAGPEAQSLPTSIQEYLFAQGQGYGGSFQDYQNEAGGASTLSATAAEAVSNAESGLRAIETLRQSISNPLLRSDLGASVFNRDVQFARNNLVDIIGRLRTGAVINDEEAKNFKRFLPNVLDSQEVAANKLDELQRLLSGVASRTTGQPAGTDALDAALDQAGFNRDLGTSQNGLGSLSERYESGGNPGAIGYDSTGGYSYGTYQLAHNNALNFVNQSRFRNEFAGLTFNSPEFRAKWQEVAKKSPDAFKQDQQSYIKRTHFDPQVNKIQQAGFDISKLGNVVKDVIWSTAVQHGPGTNIIVAALNALKPGANEADLVREIYARRWGGGANFRSSTEQVRNAVYNRFFGQQGELNQALSRLA